jgi:hypothetical protein
VEAEILGTIYRAGRASRGGGGGETVVAGGAPSTCQLLEGEATTWSINEGE